MNEKENLFFMKGKKLKEYSVFLHSLGHQPHPYGFALYIRQQRHAFCFFYINIHF